MENKIILPKDSITQCTYTLEIGFDVPYKKDRIAFGLHESLFRVVR